MSKKLILGLCLFNLTFFTGCLDEVIQALCDEIGEANVIAVVVSSTPDLSAKEFVVEYENESAQTIVFDSCEGDFEDLNGEINHSAGSIEIGSFLLTDSLKDFFFTSEGIPDSRQFIVTVKIKDDCNGTPESTITNASLAEPVWTDVSDDVSTEQCSITAHAGALTTPYDL